MKQRRPALPAHRAEQKTVRLVKRTATEQYAKSAPILIRPSLASTESRALLVALPTRPIRVVLARAVKASSLALIQLNANRLATA